MLVKKKEPPNKPYSINEAIEYLGEYGSYKRNPSDGVLGLKSVWRGLFRLYHALDTINIMAQVKGGKDMGQG